MASLSLLQRCRLSYQPKLPALLQDLSSLIPVEAAPCQIEAGAGLEALKALFPKTSQQPILSFKKGASRSSPPLKIGVVLSGGQAPGGHNVISGLFDSLKKLNRESQLIGFCDGPAGLIKNKTIEIVDSLLSSYRNQGGFDMIGSGRTKIETPEQFAAAAATVQALNLDGLVIIGGDDSNTNAAFLAEHFERLRIKTRVVGVPKTIDGDLKNAFIEISFGFDTACKIYSEIIGNILKDMLSAKKYYYFIKLMGRSASHIALECGLQTHVNMTLISEEIAEKKQTLSQLVQQIVDMIVVRAREGKNYGALLIPEGVIEFIPEFKTLIQELNQRLAVNQPHLKQVEAFENRKDKIDYISRQLSQTSLACFSGLPEEIQEQLLLDRDPHGNVQVSKIETERLLIKLVEAQLKKLAQEGKYTGKLATQPLFCGYEGRSGLPSNFDSQYCYALGSVAALLIKIGATGYMCGIKNLTRPVEEWDAIGVPIFSLLHAEEREGQQKTVIRKALVDLTGQPFLLLKDNRERWMKEDDYLSPGPIQFEGPLDLTESCPLTLLHERKCK